MIALTFTLELQEPLLMTAIDGDPNSAVSLPYVPGSALRGALVGRYLAADNGKNLAADAAARKLFFNAQTRYLNAYLVDEMGERTLPTPHSWQKCKGDQGQYSIYDLSVDPKPEKLQQPKSLKRPFCQLAGTTVDLYKVEKQVNIHTLRDPKAGRALGKAGRALGEGEQGAVFRYEALEPGQTLAGAILCPDSKTADTLQALLDEDETLLLGGSQSAGYGLTTITEVKQEDNWQETPRDLSAPSGRLTLTLLSDAILRDVQGQYTGFLTPEILAEYLGAKLTLDRARTFTQVGVVGGFNRKWGLPLPQTPVAKAGSVFTFKVDEQGISTEHLQKLVENGIGERRAEGFGRVALNWHAQHDELEVPQSQPRRKPLETAAPLTGTSADMAQKMATRMLRQQLEQSLRKRVLSLKIQGDIHNTQLSAVRTRVRTALATGEVAPIEKYLDEMKAVGQKQFEQAKINGHPANKWVKKVLQEDAHATWQRLGNTSFNKESLPVVGGVRAVWDDTIAQEYALRLIDGVLSHELAHRRNKEVA
ncbi:MAG: type III-B CRISPR module-associated Cmr3 family protein [Chloroflexota bacterium]|nr:type III-B CRISPR module-associated Cmr3 family protein [Chloroflexota bacterium]